MGLVTVRSSGLAFSTLACHRRAARLGDRFVVAYSATNNIYVAESYDGNTFFKQEAVTSGFSATNYQRQPSIATDSVGDLHVVWYGKGWGAYTAQPNIKYRKRESGVWLSTESVTDVNFAQESGSPAMAINSQDTVFVAWAGSGWLSNPADNNIIMRARVGGVWGCYEAVSNSGLDAGLPGNLSSPAIAIDSQDRVHLVCRMNYGVFHRMRDAY